MGRKFNRQFKGLRGQMGPYGGHPGPSKARGRDKHTPVALSIRLPERQLPPCRHAPRLGSLDHRIHCLERVQA